MNIRPLLTTDPGPDVFLNAASQYARKDWLGTYRKAGSQAGSTSKVPIDAELVWELAASYKASMNKFIQSRKTIQDFLTGRLLGEDNENIGRFYGLDLYQNNSFLISNVGVFEPRESKKDGGWTIQEVGFSAASIRAAMGDIGPSFNVASAKNGDCIISTTYENVVLKDKMVKFVLQRLLSRMKTLV